MTYTDAELIAMVETNVRSMTDEFLRTSWQNAYDKSMQASGEDRRLFWRRVRDIYAFELDRRSVTGRHCGYCGAPAIARTIDYVNVCSGHSDMRHDTYLPTETDWTGTEDYYSMVRKGL